MRIVLLTLIFLFLPLTINADNNWYKIPADTIDVDGIWDLYADWLFKNHDLSTVQPHECIQISVWLMKDLDFTDMPYVYTPYIYNRRVNEAKELPHNMYSSDEFGPTFMQAYSRWLHFSRKSEIRGTSLWRSFLEYSRRRGVYAKVEY